MPDQSSLPSNPATSPAAMSPGDSSDLPPFSAAMLAGGASRRMGADKAFLDVDLDGEPMAARILVSVILAGASDAIAVGGNQGALADLGWRTVPDEWPGEGPLGGLIGALEAAAQSTVVILGCDHPDVDPDEIVALVSTLHANPAASAAIPVLEGYPYVTHSAWRTSAAPVLRGAFEVGERAPSALLRRLTWIPVAVANERSIADLDTAAQLEERRQGRR
jgi:molybdenum cofactor guanylyltransferase